jgi:hypothetical protein
MRFKGLVKDIFRPNNLIIKVNYYHCGSTPDTVSPVNIAELPGSFPIKDGIELPCEPVNRGHLNSGRPGRLETILEEPCPPVRTSMKPATVKRRSKRGTHLN